MACSAALRWIASAMISRARCGRAFARFGLQPLDQVGGVAPRVRFELLQQDVARLVGAQSGDALQFALAFAAQLLGPGVGGGDRLLLECEFLLAAAKVLFDPLRTGETVRERPGLVGK